MSAPEFAELPLHDAVLGRVEMLWSEKLCRLHLLVFASPGEPAAPHILEFNGVTLATLPRKEPWGPSSSIMASKREGAYKIEMQSGDCLEVEACGFQLLRL